MRYLLVSLLIATCACKDKRTPDSARPAPPPPAASSPAVVNPDAAPQLAPRMTAEPARYLLTRASLDGLDAGVVVDVPTLSQRVAPHVVVKAERSVEGEPYTVYEIRDGKTLLYWVEPGESRKLWRAVVVSPTIKTPEGIAVGSSPEDLTKVVGALDCGEGDEDMSVYFLCTSERTPELTFLFDAPEDGRPLSMRNELVRIHWSPGA